MDKILEYIKIDGKEYGLTQSAYFESLTPTEIAHAYGVLEDEGNACEWDYPELKG